MAVTAEKLVQAQLSDSNAIVSNIVTAIHNSVITLSTTKVIAVSDDGGSALFARVETIAAGGAVTNGNKYTVYNGAVTHFACVGFSATKFLITYSVGNSVYAVVGDESSGVLTFGLPQTIITGSNILTSVCAKVSDSSVIILLTGAGLVNAYKVVACTVSGTVLTFGTAITFALESLATTIQSIGVLDANTAIIGYYGTDDVLDMTVAAIVYISGTTLTLQQPILDVTSATGYQFGNRLVRLDDTHILIAYQDASILTNVFGAVGVVTNGSIVWGAKTTLCTATTPQDGGATSCFDISMMDATHIFLSYTDSATVIRNVVCTISAGTTITPETAGKADVTVGNAAIKNIMNVMLTSALFVVSYLDSGTTIKTYACSVSGTTVTAGGLTATMTTIGTGFPGILARLTDTTFLISYTFASNTIIRAASISTVTITLGSAVQVNANVSFQNSYDIAVLDDTHGVLFYKPNVSPYSVRCIPFSISTITITAGTEQILPQNLLVNGTQQIKVVTIDATHVAMYSNLNTGLAESHLRLYSIDGSYVLTEIDKVPVRSLDFGYTVQNQQCRTFIKLSSTKFATFGGITMRGVLFKYSTTKLYTNSAGSFLSTSVANNQPIAVLDSSTAILYGQESLSGVAYPMATGVKIVDYLPCCGTKSYMNAIAQTGNIVTVTKLTATTAIITFRPTTSNPLKLYACVLTIDGDAELTAGTQSEVLNSVAVSPSRVATDVISATRIVLVCNSNVGVIIKVLDESSGIVTCGTPTTLITGATGGHTEISSLYFTNETAYDAVLKLYAHGSGTSSANLIYNSTLTAGTTTSLLKPNSPIVLPDGDTLRATTSLVAGAITLTAYGLEEV